MVSVSGKYDPSVPGLRALALQAAATAPPNVPSLDYMKALEHSFGSGPLDVLKDGEDPLPFPLSSAWNLLPLGSVLTGYMKTPDSLSTAKLEAEEGWIPVIIWNTEEGWSYLHPGYGDTTGKLFTETVPKGNVWMARLFQTYLVKKGTGKAISKTAAKKYWKYYSWS